MVRWPGNADLQVGTAARSAAKPRRASRAKDVRRGNADLRSAQRPVGPRREEAQRRNGSRLGVDPCQETPTFAHLGDIYFYAPAMLTPSQTRRHLESASETTFCGADSYTAIILAVGARRKPRDQHRDNKTLVSSDFAEVQEASAHPVSARPGNRGVCFLPFRRAIPAPIGGKLAEIGRDTPRHHDNRRVGGMRSTRLLGRRERDQSECPVPGFE